MGRMIISSKDLIRRASEATSEAVAGVPDAPTRPSPASAPPPPSAIDGYVDRVAKYIPGEVIVPYITMTELASRAPAEITKDVSIITLLWGCFIFGLIATPVYLWVRFKKEQKQSGLPPKIAQIVISTLAFVVWAVALQSATADVIIHPFWGRLALPVFTFLVGLIEP